MADRVVDRAAGEVELTAVSKPAVSETAAVCIAVTNSQNSAGFPSREACPVCLCSMPLRIEGRFRIHGPIRDRCPGSGSLPASVSITFTAVSEEAVLMPLNEGSSTTDLLSYLRSCSKILKRVPRASRERAVRKLAAIQFWRVLCRLITIRRGNACSTFQVVAFKSRV